MRRSERWRHMKNDLGKSEKEIIASFDKPTQMEIFAWEKGKYSEIDTVMKPMDSMRYYKSFFASSNDVNGSTNRPRKSLGGRYEL